MKLLQSMLAGTGVCLALASAAAQTFPSQPIHFIVPFPAGTTTDNTARFIGRQITVTTGQPVVVENKGGADGIIGAQYAARQPGDGYTVFIGTNTTNAANASLFKKLPYDAQRDFLPVSRLIVGGTVLAVKPSTPATNVQELLAYARQNPGRVSFGGGSSSSRMSGELLQQLSGAKLLYVPYKGVASAINDVLGGQITMVFADAVAVMPLVRAGQLRALGVSTRERMPGYGDIPTLEEQGVKGYALSGWLAAFVPAGTPAQVVDRLNQLIVDVLKSPEAEEYFAKNAWRTSPTSPEELGAFVKSETLAWRQMVEKAGIEPE
jgi:tripartite-type tricarboxylate transporter receptor subunit TctC